MKWNVRFKVHYASTVTYCDVNIVVPDGDTPSKEEVLVFFKTEVLTRDAKFLGCMDYQGAYANTHPSPRIVTVDSINSVTVERLAPDESE